jgi:lipid II:glycine glycyltransferase (peptidoglycan interpeptide bridge formation enzyme)
MGYYQCMDLAWNPSDPEEWDDFHRRHHGALQQSWAYGEALNTLGVHVHRVLFRAEGQLMGIAQLGARRWLGYVYLASCTRGPVWGDAVHGAARRHFYRQIKRTLPANPWRVVLFSPDSTATEMVEPEGAGMSRVMTGYATASLDLRQSLPELRAQMASKWRNRLHKAESDPSLHVFVQPSLRQCEKLLGNEESQRRERGFHGLPVGFVRAYIQAHAQPERAYVVAWAHQKQETTASMLVLLHGSTATYHMGWANDMGRKSNAHNLLLWRLIEHLKAQGVEKFDLGGINTSDLPGITRFKLGSGAVPRMLAGTYF